MKSKEMSNTAELLKQKFGGGEKKASKSWF